ncbi:MAG TPA: phosphohydrolase [Flavobacteriales bacterium]|nr:phosphohydrolase [Flavobacteriales bacterium]
MEEQLLERAIRLAVKVHKGQKDRAGKPYILHVLRVMMRGTTLEEQVLGALHDVLERSSLTTEDLGLKGFPPQILQALAHISRQPEEDYAGYIDRVAQNNLALRVKLHDLSDKMDIRQAKELDQADLKRYNRQLAAFHKLRQLAGEGDPAMPMRGGTAPQ